MFGRLNEEPPPRERSGNIPRPQALTSAGRRGRLTRPAGEGSEAVPLEAIRHQLSRARRGPLVGRSPGGPDQERKVQQSPGKGPGEGPTGHR